MLKPANEEREGPGAGAHGGWALGGRYSWQLLALAASSGAGAVAVHMQATFKGSAKNMALVYCCSYNGLSFRWACLKFIPT